MHPRILSFLLFLAFSLPAWAQLSQDFPPDIIPAIAFTETRHENVAYFGDLEDYDRYYDKASIIVTCRASLKGVDLSTIDEDTFFSINISGGLSDFVFDGLLGDGIISPPVNGTTKVVLPIDADGDGIDDGDCTIRYSQNEVSFLVTLNDDIDGLFSPLAYDLEGDEYAPNDYETIITGGFEFGDYSADNRNLYVVGQKVAIYSKTVGVGTELEQTFDDLVDVLVHGENDSTRPSSVTIRNPAARITVNQKPYQIVVEAADDHEVFEVLVQVNGGPFENCTLQPDGTWTIFKEFVKNNTAFPFNTIVAKAIDQDGNERTMDTARQVKFSPISTLTVDAAGTGSGKVAGGFIAVINYVAGTPSPVRTSQELEGDQLTLTATPVKNVVFDGWTSNISLTNAQKGSPVLHFEMFPNMMLTAHFLPNPFLGVKGIYGGLATSATPNHRGFFKATLTPIGAFTGTLKIGKLSVPLKGRFSNAGLLISNDGFTPGPLTVTLKGVTYTFNLALNVQPTGARQITGTVTYGGVTSAITGDLAAFNTKTNPAEQAGKYNVLLAGPAAPADPNFPLGIGAGRVVLTKLGLATFAGKLGDGTKVSFGTTMSQADVWPFFVSLYGGRGSISGSVAFRNQPTTDLDGQLDWFKPGPLNPLKPDKVHPEGFAGTVSVAGVKYIAPAKGTRVFLAPSGAGELLLDAKAVTLGTLAAPIPAPAIDSTDAVTLLTDNKFTLPSDARVLKLTVTASTGLFVGSFTETFGAKKIVTAFSGAILRAKGTSKGVAGGSFTRGNRTGAVQVVEPVP